MWTYDHNVFVCVCVCVFIFVHNLKMIWIFSPFGDCEKIFYKHKHKMYYVNIVYHFSWVNTLETESLGIMISMFNFMRNCQALLQNGGIILHFQQKHPRVPTVLHLHQRWVCQTP